MKKIIISGLLLLGIAPFAQARVTVTNNTKSPIAFSYHWLGALPIDTNPFDFAVYYKPSNWRDSYDWPNPINPGMSDTQTVDVGNIKLSYTVGTPVTKTQPNMPVAQAEQLLKQIQSFPVFSGLNSNAVGSLQSVLQNTYQSPGIIGVNVDITYYQPILTYTAGTSGDWGDRHITINPAANGTITLTSSPM